MLGMLIHFLRAVSHFHLLVVLPASYLSRAVEIFWELSTGPNRIPHACFGHLHHHNVIEQSFLPWKTLCFDSDPSSCAMEEPPVEVDQRQFPSLPDGDRFLHPRLGCKRVVGSPGTQETQCSEGLDTRGLGCVRVYIAVFNTQCVWVQNCRLLH